MLNGSDPLVSVAGLHQMSENIRLYTYWKFRIDRDF